MEEQLEQSQEGGNIIGDGKEMVQEKYEKFHGEAEVNQNSELENNNQQNFTSDSKLKKHNQANSVGDSTPQGQPYSTKYPVVKMKAPLNSASNAKLNSQGQPIQARNSKLKSKDQAGNAVAAKEKTQGHKIILFWTHFFGRWDYEFGLGHSIFLDHKCPVSNCLTTNDHSLITQASAVVFHMRNVRHDTQFPKIRFENQSYIFFLQENPYNQWNELSQYNGIFNLTMTYRKDSDAPVPYGLVTNTPPDRLTAKELNELTAGKTNLIAWFVSNCGPTHSRREEYAKELQRYVPVDIYGKCGPLSCPDKDVPLLQARMDPDCYGMVERKYKFYLSFENIVCKDYITEKVFR